MSLLKPEATGLLEHESALLRLFRCMTEGEQEGLLFEVLTKLAKRYSFDPTHKRLRPEDLQLELQNDDLDSRMMAVWPGGWPGQEIVELDNLGDPGAWFDINLADPPSEFLFSVPMNYEPIADNLVEPYLSEIVGQGYPVPSDFESNPTHGGWTEEDEDFVRADFVAFFSHWRERILTAIEEQSRSSK